MPDAANALIRPTNYYQSARPVKHSAIRQFHAPCRMRLRLIRTYKLPRSRRPDKHSAIRQFTSTVPDAANALSGRQITCSRRPDKGSAIRQFRAPHAWMLPTPYPAYKLHAAVGLISTAPSGSSGAPCRMRLTPYPAYKLHAAVGLISTAPSGSSSAPCRMRLTPYPACTTTCSRRPDKHSAIRQFRAPCRMRLMPHPAYKLHAVTGLISCGNIGVFVNQAISSAVLPFGAGYALSTFNSSTRGDYLQRGGILFDMRYACGFRMAITIFDGESPMPAKSACANIVRARDVIHHRVRKANRHAVVPLGQRTVCP